jgi:ubiquinone/menaquinone biosynthesis C-methylase UbiE
MGKTRTKIEYIPALKYDWLTTSFDTFVRLTMPERQFRSALILQAGITAGRRVLDFGAGTAALSLLAKQLVPQSEVTAIDIDEKIIGIAKKKSRSPGCKSTSISTMVLRFHIPMVTSTR